MHRKAGHTTYACPGARPAGRRVRGHRPCTQIPGSHSPRPEGQGMLSSSLSHLAGASCLSGLPPSHLAEAPVSPLTTLLESFSRPVQDCGARGGT